MSNLRLLFEKQGTTCYISHLDLMRTFQRLFLRGGGKIILRAGAGDAMIVSRRDRRTPTRRFGAGRRKRSCLYEI